MERRLSRHVVSCLQFMSELEHDGATEPVAILRCQARRQLPRGATEITIGRYLPVRKGKFLRNGGASDAKNHLNSVLCWKLARYTAEISVIMSGEPHVHRTNRHGGHH
jgi:hypothetical protein